MGGGTEAFPDLGRHCQHSLCNQLDFLPFKCDACQRVFCLDHRSYKSHDCPKSGHNSRRVVVCEVCSSAIEITGRGKGDAGLVLEEHEKSSACDPAKKKKKPTCAVSRCKEVLTFSNTFTCKTCRLKVCLKHRFPADHSCTKEGTSKTTAVAGRRWNDKFLVSFSSRNGKDCANVGTGSASPTSAPSPSFLMRHESKENPLPWSFFCLKKNIILYQTELSECKKLATLRASSPEC